MDQIQSNHPNSQLHLPNLTIKEFRGIKSLSIPKLGRVTLFAGKNAVGKTSVLESVAMFATRSHFSMLSRLQKNREEFMNMEDDLPNIEALFYRREALENEPVVIGSLDKANQLTIEKVSFNRLSEEQRKSVERFIKLYRSDRPLQLFIVKFKDQEIVFPQTNLQKDTEDIQKRLRFWRYYEQEEISSRIPFEVLGTGLLSNQKIGQLWDKIALTDKENQAVEPLKLIFGDKLDRIAVTGENRRYGRRVIVKLKDHSDPVPLKSLGDGAVRLFSISLALANSHGGILTIDEAENGIHHSIQKDFWNMILQTAYKNDIQVLATTHSWDCTRGFAQTAIENENSKGLLIRLDRHGEEVKAIPYSEEELKVAVDQGIEVR